MIIPRFLAALAAAAVVSIGAGTYAGSLIGNRLEERSRAVRQGAGARTQKAKASHPRGALRDSTAWAAADASGG
jgi:hypothetical protein